MAFPFFDFERTWWRLFQKRVVCTKFDIYVFTINEARRGLWLRQTEHIRGHLWHKFSATFNKVMMTTVNISKLWFSLATMNPWFSILLGSRKTLSRKEWYEHGISLQLRNRHYICECCYIYEWNVQFFCHKVSLITGPRCQLVGVVLGMKQT